MCLCYNFPMNKKVKTILSLIGVIVVLILGAYLLQQVGDRLPIKEYAQQLGLLGYVFLLLGIILGGVVVPLSCLPFLFAGLALYGFWPTFVLYYLGNTIIAPIIDFWIARKYGRPAVLKLAGKKAIVQIDKLTEVAGTKALIVLRFFGGILFDSISYAMGLTIMEFKHYLLITALCPIPGMILTLYFLYKGLSSCPLFLGAIVVWGYLAGALTFYWLYRKNKKVTKS